MGKYHANFIFIIHRAVLLGRGTFSKVKKFGLKDCFQKVAFQIEKSAFRSDFFFTFWSIFAPFAYFPPLFLVFGVISIIESKCGVSYRYPSRYPSSGIRNCLHIQIFFSCNDIEKASITMMSNDARRSDVNLYRAQIDGESVPSSSNVRSSSVEKERDPRLATFECNSALIAKDQLLLGDEILRKYWCQRYRLFEKFDEGVMMDRGNLHK